MGNYSVRPRVLVATAAARLEFSEKWTGFWIVSSCQPQGHVHKQLPNIFRVGCITHLRFPLFQSGQINMSLNRVRSAAGQALPESRLAHGILWSCRSITRKVRHLNPNSKTAKQGRRWSGEASRPVIDSDITSVFPSFSAMAP